MKILHIASGASGGAYRAAKNLYELQLESGLNVSLIGNVDRSFGRRLWSKIVTAVDQLISKPKFGVMSIYSTNGLRTRQIKKFHADILHIHNWFNLLSAKQVIALSEEIPVVLTMHDERLLTGGCHNHLDCPEFNNFCKSCPAIRIPIGHKIRENRAQSEQLIRSKGISIISPSDWLAKQVELSSGGGVNPSVIANPIRRIFHTDEKNNQNQGTQESLKLVFIAANPWVPLKGLSELLDALTALENEHKFSLDIVGKSDTNIRYAKFARIRGQLDGENLTSAISEADLIVVPSKSENFPGVICEAQLLGKVVVATNVGGIPEMILDLETGVLQQENETLMALLKRAMSLTQRDREKIGLNAKIFSRNRFNEELILKLTMQVYVEAVENAK